MVGNTNPLPLFGMVVLDLSQILAGPVCGMMLADMGADVIKVEKPDGGDDNRRAGPPFIGGQGAGFMAANRNKRSLALNLRDESGRQVFERLLERADVVVENFRPGVMERLGIGYERLSKLKPSLIYCSISGHGGTGPYKDRGGFDLIAQGMSGLMSITGVPDGVPVKVGVPITDISAGILAANGVLCAYIHAQKTGQGQLVDTSLLEAGIAYTIWESSGYFADGEIPGPLGSAHRVLAPYQALRTSDGYINIGAANQRTWEQLCRAIGQEELIEDQRFKEPGDRKAREGELADLLEETFRGESTAYWLEAFEKVGMVAGPINDISQVYEDPQVIAREMKVDLEDPDLGTLHNIGIPVKLSATPGRIRRRAPMLGEHSWEILTESGFAEKEIEELFGSGVVVDGRS
ncbi:MAG TPA: CoA transferase [Dehalococcoidia bacterium]|jgi:crotonobetainyl-CoA:carnitine CoA-transferase CaiB-like acyl-CoA transferase|nr:CoA transferase [Dehalococcoidia bacterium]MEE2926674.1 CoA transferase [Chloroflexota bacterium]HIB11907.1 CoA transferase [Dehalococcoidia bacterium]HIM48718.1 CoA transferase [Dehalococcoidia bacterium]|tara:strand:- start:8307 stop:9524 length:1218 start_codon:yes stop_codon:yes gene_type:complete